MIASGHDNKLDDDSASSSLDDSSSSLINRTRRHLLPLTSPERREKTFEKISFYMQNNIKLVENQLHNKQQNKNLADDCSLSSKTNEKSPLTVNEAKQRIVGRIKNIRLFAPPPASMYPAETQIFSSYSEFEKSLLWTDEGPPRHWASTPETLQDFIDTATYSRGWRQFGNLHEAFSSVSESLVSSSTTAMTTLRVDRSNSEADKSDSRDDNDGNASDAVDYHDIISDPDDTTSSSSSSSIYEHNNDGDSCGSVEQNINGTVTTTASSNGDCAAEVDNNMNDDNAKWKWANTIGLNAAARKGISSSLQAAVSDVREARKRVLQDTKKLNVQVMKTTIPIIHKMKTSFNEDRVNNGSPTAQVSDACQ